MNIIKFGFFSPTDFRSLLYTHELSWSRVYEYVFATTMVQRYKNVQREIIDYTNELEEDEISIHNCSWGFRDIHVVFKTALDFLNTNVTHSDIIPSTLVGTEIWDITTPSKYKNKFDIVINVSTIEEVQGDHVQIIKNHLDQLKEGGWFIMTFDYPGLHLAEVERFLMRNIDVPEIKLNPRNSVLPDRVLGLPDDFNVGYLVIEK